MRRSLIPHAKRIHGHTTELGALLLRHVGVATQLAKRVHVFTMPFIPKFMKRPPEYQAGTHAHFSSSSPHSEERDDVIC